ncbi:hypothetical protein Rhe02_18860 [Rhizocola hellebori]|uniref:Uncharacterized protein n=1 Tax=Rhizocola hellebori TaxID=1392758 RepID=A0A8J3VDS9_9ACTN|nr:hypothetical protein Rhe02_18860 [Rhizocola hellebori]
MGVAKVDSNAVNKPVIDRLPKPRPRVSLADAVAERISRERQIAKAVREASRSEIARRLKMKAEGAAVARRVLGRKPIRGRANNNGMFVPRGVDPGEALERSRAEGLRRLKSLHDNRRGMVVPAAELGLGGAGSAVPARIADALFRAAIRKMRTGSAVDVALRRCEAKAKAASENAPTGTGAGAPVTAIVGDVVEPSTQQRVAAILDSDYLDGAVDRPTRQVIRDNLQRAVPSGPADADAFYDYPTLQVAWSDVWTAVVDGITDQKIRELYAEIVEVVDPEAIPADLSEIDELHDLLDALSESVAAASSTLAAPSELAAWEPTVGENWASLSFADQEYIRFLNVADGFIVDVRNMHGTVQGALINGNDHLDDIEQFENYPDSYIPPRTLASLVDDEDYFRREARSVVRDAKKDSGGASSRLGRAEKLIAELKEQMVAPYQFDVFAVGAYNFGILATYRQRWRPTGYQAGDLAGAIALAPNEKRSYTVERKSSRKNTRNSETERMLGGSSESGQTGRAEAEIVSAAKRAQTMSANYSPKVDVVGVVGAEIGGAEFGGSQDSSSSSTKKDIREFTRKAAQEYRDSNKVTVGSEQSWDRTVTEKRDIENPNNELTVTYLFYELQRRYEVAERLADLVPVILVAYEVPAPHEITEAWLLRHDWIIRKALLDKTFASALRYLSRSFAGDEVSVEVLEQQWRTQLAVVAETRRQSTAHTQLRDEARKALERAVQDVAQVQSGLSPADVQAALGPAVGGWLSDRLFGDSEEESQADANNAQHALEWADADLAQLDSAMRESLTVLERATEAYVAGVRKRLDRRTQIDRLILHVKENIFHYMQAIWDCEHPDQRYLRLYDMEIQWPGATGEAVLTDLDDFVVRSDLRIRAAPAGLPDLMDNVVENPVAVLFGTPELKEKRRLHQVADLTRPLGYRGNLAVFPLREHNALSTYLAQDLLDSEFGLRDPDPLGGMPTASEAIALARCAMHRAKDEAARSRVTEWLMDALEAAHQVSQEVIVPTGELFIEGLPGSHPLLEDFKLRHRAYDAEKAKAEAISAHIESLRRGLRLQDGDLADPDVDRYIKVDGSVAPVLSIDGA